MKHQNKLVLLSALLAASGLIGCNNESDSCGLREESCQSVGKTLDADQCICVENGSLCTAGKHVFGNGCENDSLENCGQHDYNCTTSSGWKSGTCTNGACIAAECTDGYHKYQNACEKDDLTSCGSHENDCSTSQTGWSTGVCNNGVCQALSCIENMHPEDGICVPDNPKHCGAQQIDCTTAVQGWSDGNCLNGECKVSSCSKGFHFAEGQCLADTNTCCGTNCTNCEDSDQICSLGQCFTNCDPPLTSCGNECVDINNIVVVTVNVNIQSAGSRCFA